ncbi:MAG TPA: hypothetical protein VNN20_12340 [Thermodesulfobacteriota bacterium]|nr:hypothetical protein [Thermodesulfobacteriota bacterium]
MRGFFNFILKNDGDISAHNVSVDHIELRYEKLEKRVRFSGGDLSDFNPIGKRWMYELELLPNDTMSDVVGEFIAPVANDPNQVGILYFDVSYYRDTDGRNYRKRCTYYYDDGNILTEPQLRQKEYYRILAAEVSRHLRETKSLNDWYWYQRQ